MGGPGGDLACTSRKGRGEAGHGRLRGGGGGAMRRDGKKGGKGASKEASPRDGFTGEISSQGSDWQKRKQSLGNRIRSQMARD